MILNKSIFSLLLSLLLASAAIAQNSNDYQLATRLMQQQKYAEALPVLRELHNENPQTYIYADRLIDCLIQLKEYDQGLEVTERFAGKADFDNQIQIRIGELYHFKGQKDKALDIWFSNIERYPEQFQIYITTARTMINRREYIKAVDVYKKGRTIFQDKRLFFGDIANAYMRAGEYELAIDEWLASLENSPNQMSFIQRNLLRYNDPVLYDIVIVELDEKLKNISITDPNYQTFYNLQIWLLQESELFRRALATAREYESRSTSYNYSLFNLGKQLIENNEFDLAVQAFTYYTDNAYGDLKWRSLEELANAYSKQAKYLDDYNLDFSNKRDSLYHLANTMLDSIETETNSYARMNNILLKRAEIALDHIFDLNKAEESFQKLKKTSSSANNLPEILYLDGRINLAKKEYAAARISFTRANKKANIGEMAEKTRYFLALTDFYAGDFEFATIQLKSLGRQFTSYYANDALKLRLWLQQGLAEDSTGSNLSKFAEAVFKENNGEQKESAKIFSNIIEGSEANSLKDDAILFYVHSNYVTYAAKLSKLTEFISISQNSPLKEKLLWEQAKLAEQVTNPQNKQDCNTAEDCLFYDKGSSISARNIYEELILLYPQGFYAPFARERLSALTNDNS